MTTMLASVVSLHDVEDAEAFVGACITRSRVLLTEDQRDDLMLEGLAILCEMASRYQPRMAGHSKDGRFSGYAAAFLPKKLSGAWHRMNEHHRQVTRPDGSREYVYYRPPKSITELEAQEVSTGSDRPHKLPMEYRNVRNLGDFVTVTIPS